MAQPINEPYRERIVACFKALATGDAIGKQTEMVSHHDVRRWYPGGITGFHGSPGEVIPRYVGNPKHQWLVGETTDDTEQTLAVARALLSNRGWSHTAVGRELLKCWKSVHPGVKSIWALHQSGDPSRIASDGDGCGAPMRVAPVGALYSPTRLDQLVRGAYESSVPTHGGQLAICAAAGVAAAISAAIEGMPTVEVLRLAVEAARRAETFARAAKGKTRSSIATLIQEMHVKLSGREALLASELAEEYFPDRPESKSR